MPTWPGLACENASASARPALTRSSPASADGEQAAPHLALCGLHPHHQMRAEGATMDPALSS